jgi:hypothetical protein
MARGMSVALSDGMALPIWVDEHGQRLVMGGSSILHFEMTGPESYYLFFATHHFTASTTVPRGRKGGAPPSLTSIEADVTATSQATNVGETLGRPITCHPSASRRVS